MTTTIANLDRAAFVNALTTVCRVTEKRNTIPILANVLIRGDGECVTIRGTDLDCETTVRVDGATAESPFAFTLPSHKALDILKKAKNSQDLSLVMLDAEKVQLTLAGSLRIAMDTLPVADFPSFKIDESQYTFELSTADLLDALQRVQFCISYEETRYYLNGVYMVPFGKSLRFVATDGHRLARHDIGSPEGATKAPGVIIRTKTVNELIALCKAKSAPGTVHVQYFGTEKHIGQIRFTIGGAELLAKPINGDYPDYQRVIPTQNSNVLTVSRSEISDAVKEVSCVSSERVRAVKISMNGDTTFTVVNPDLGTARKSIPYEIDGKHMDIGFNAQYLLGVLDHVQSDEVEMRFGDSGSPTLVTGASGVDHGTVFVLMPMRV